jgi:DNA-binding transcriptional LysR family regulator
MKHFGKSRILRGQKKIISRGSSRTVAKHKEEFIELRHLRYFITLAEELHFARAAARLQIEQSPLSRAIRDLEDLLGVRLFERNTRSTRITRAGRVLQEYARRAIALIEQAITSTRSAALGHSEQLRIGVSDCTAYCRTMQMLARFKEAYPNVSVSLHEMPLHRQIAALRDDLLDASISLDGGHREGIDAQLLECDAICAVLSPGHPLANFDVISHSELARWPLILFSDETDLGGGSQIDDFANSLGRLHVAFRASSLGTMLTLVALGHGVGLVGGFQAMAINRRDVAVRRIAGVEATIVTYVLHSDCGVSEPLSALIDLVRRLAATTESPAGPS